jgi:hypothetical protein
MLDFLLALLPVWMRPRVIMESRQRASAWRQIRADHLEKEPACVACGRTDDVRVHHIIPVSISPTLELDTQNLITLCTSPCHIVFGHFLNYNCYNKDVRKMAQEYRKSFNKRKCQLARF